MKLTFEPECGLETVRLSTSRSRNMLSVNSLVGIIYASNSRFVPSPTDQKSLYSYLQYHWCPIVLRVSEESTDSSNIYRSNSEGKAICNNKMAGIIVQTHSTICISSKPMLMYTYNHYYYNHSYESNNEY